MIKKIPLGYIYAGLCVAWIGALIVSSFITRAPFGIEEAAAKGLLLGWSFADRIASPAGTFGPPDLRAILFAPVVLYWPGSILAAKVFSAVIGFLATLLLYQWSNKQGENSEGSLIAAALLLVSPYLLLQIESMASGPYLLLAFSLGAFIHRKYHESNRLLGGWYFLQLLNVALAVSLHPIGLAYPVALIWHWLQQNENAAHRKAVIIGAIVVTSLIGAFRMGWTDSAIWLSNPLRAFGSAATNGLSTLEPNANIAGSVILLTLLAALIFKERKAMMSDMLGRMVVVGVVLGAFTAGAAWSLLVVTALLFYGIPLLIRVNESLNFKGLLGQRGALMITVMFIATSSLLADKAHVHNNNLELISPTDELIRTVCADAGDPEKVFRAASEWPARTMLACKRDVFPLPRAAENGEALLARIEGITHLLFNHGSAKNQDLARNIAELAGATETLSVQKEGVVVRIRPASDRAEIGTHESAE